MAFIPSADMNTQKILKIFSFYNIKPGEALPTNVFSSRAAEVGLSHEDIGPALDACATRGWTKDKANGAVELTEDGFAEIQN
ncbi:hypothetical protein [Aureimonas ureilytica]|uniref:hypothetical protein n=1 Tax=Aureimonas ureilytica TaxID=401562 RepID=UPI00128F1182|nr:hypothetical protein [Aureimonas ureilytica]